MKKNCTTEETFRALNDLRVNIEKAIMDFQHITGLDPDIVITRQNHVLSGWKYKMDISITLKVTGE